MPGRKYQAGKGSYRYGFNGKENDNDVKGTGNQQDYGMRIYDPRLGRFLSIDPLTASYPFYTPYQFAGNKPIAFTDLDGLEPIGNISDAHRAEEWAYDKLVEQKILTRADADQSIKSGRKGEAAAAIIGVTIAIDIFVTKGWLTRMAMGTQVLGVIEHNRAPSVQGRAEQNKRSKEALADVAITYGFGKILGFAGRVLLETAKPISIALGLTNGKQLETFAKSVNAFHVEDWEKQGLYSNKVQSFPEAFNEATTKAVNSGGKIKFDLTNFDIERAIQAKGKSLYDAGVGYTDWEFNQILGDKKLLKATEFYENGKLIKTSDVIKKVGNKIN
jgi:RHS repeat-associated protein